MFDQDTFLSQKKPIEIRNIIMTFNFPSLFYQVNPLPHMPILGSSKEKIHKELMVENCVLHNFSISQVDFFKKEAGRGQHHYFQIVYRH